MVHVDNEGIIDGLWTGEMKCIGPTAKDADVWMLIREELHRVHQEGILVDVKHIKALRRQTSQQKRERLLTEELWRR